VHQNKNESREISIEQELQSDKSLDSIMVMIKNRIKKARAEVRDLARKKSDQRSVIDHEIPRKVLSKQRKLIRKSPDAFARKGTLLDRGIASFYGEKWNGRKTANGEIFDCEKFTAAHKTLKFDQFVKVHDLETGKSVVVRLNDRGPYKPGRVIDLSKAAARYLGIIHVGLAKVTVESATIVDFLKQFEDN